ncbi:hypothetical protein EPN87_02965 [archaeon]|nr:MAG: hypothetical protein EPN87_02965 [archaeon]
MPYVGGWIGNLPNNVDAKYLDKVLDPLDIAYECMVGTPENLFPLEKNPVFSGGMLYLTVTDYNPKRSKETLEQTITNHLRRQGLTFEPKEYKPA